MTTPRDFKTFALGDRVHIPGELRRGYITEFYYSDENSRLVRVMWDQVFRGGQWCDSYQRYDTWVMRYKLEPDTEIIGG